MGEAVFNCENRMNFFYNILLIYTFRTIVSIGDIYYKRALGIFSLSFTLIL